VDAKNQISLITSRNIGVEDLVNKARVLSHAAGLYLHPWYVCCSPVTTSAITFSLVLPVYPTTQNATFVSARPSIDLSMEAAVTTNTQELNVLWCIVSFNRCYVVPFVVLVVDLHLLICTTRIANTSQCGYGRICAIPLFAILETIIDALFTVFIPGMLVGTKAIALFITPMVLITALTQPTTIMPGGSSLASNTTFVFSSPAHHILRFDDISSNHREFMISRSRALPV
jgi:hypothetical protein